MFTLILYYSLPLLLIGGLAHLDATGVPELNGKNLCPACPQYTPGQTAVKIVEKQEIIDMNSRQGNQGLSNYILDRLTILYPMYRFVVIVYNAEYGANCEERETNRKVFVQNSNKVTGRFPVNGDKCLVVADALSNQQFAGEIDYCHGQLETQSCATRPFMVANHVSARCKGKFSALGVFAEDFEPGIAHSMPEHAFKRQTIKCANETEIKWLVFTVLQQNSSLIGEILHSNYSTLTARKIMPTKQHRVSLALFILMLFFMAVLTILIFIMSVAILFMYNFDERLKRMVCVAHLSALCFFIPSQKHEEELDPTKIDIERLLYSGPNSRVYFGQFRPHHDQDRVLPVAVKVPSKEAFQIAVIKREMRINALLCHPRIVDYIGFFRDAFQNIRIVSEFMAGGDLHTFLSRRKKNILTVGHIFNFLNQIAEGMEYLMNMQIIHRDLAARNCMLNAECTEAKIADFGLSRHFGTEAMYACSSPVRLPLRWIAIECFGKDGEILPYCIFSEKTDVWAFGMVVWECFTHGELPYGQEEIADVLGKLKDRGWRLPCPAKCPPEIYTNLMLKCWKAKPDERPTFSTLKRLIEKTFTNILEEKPDTMTQIV